MEDKEVEEMTIKLNIDTSEAMKNLDRLLDKIEEVNIVTSNMTAMKCGPIRSSTIEDEIDINNLPITKTI